MVVESLEFYRTLACLGDHIKPSRIISTTIEGMICYLQTCAELHDASVGQLTGNRKHEKCI
jgi:hypothetical protein